MHVAELWRYPVKSLGGERLEAVELGLDGIAADRRVQVVVGGRTITSRIRPKLLGLHGTLAADGTALVDGVLSLWAAITGGGILRKEDSGTLLLTGDNSYSGGTKITNGIVRVTSNTGLGSGDVTVGAVNNTLTARVDL